MTDYRQLYQEKLTTAEELAGRAENGWIIGTDAAAAYPVAILSALTERAKKDEIKGIQIHTELDVYPLEFYEDNSLFGKITGVSWFSSAGARKAINGGWADVYMYEPVEEGINHLCGHDALEYSRLRMIDDNYMRQRRQ